MAELVDALASGASEGNLLEVRVFFWAPFFYISIFFCIFFLITKYSSKKTFGRFFLLRERYKTSYPKERAKT